MKRILVVEDDRAFRERLQRSLASLGYEARSAEGMEATRESVADWSPEYAIVDLRLEDSSGLDVLQWLVRKVPDIRVVILTGYGSIATTVQAMKLGAHNYVAKPADIDEILASFEDSPLAAEEPREPRSLARIEWEIINRTLMECDGNVSETARRLGLHRRTLQRRLSKFPPSDEDGED